MKEYASAILLTPDGQLILQLRDNKPGIVDPGKLSLFAGAIKGSETPEEALVRELNEEIELAARKFTKFIDYKFENRISHVFILKNINPKTLILHEGQGYRLLKCEADFKSKYNQVAPISAAILDEYFKMVSLSTEKDVATKK